MILKSWARIVNGIDNTTLIINRCSVPGYLTCERLLFVVNQLFGGEYVRLASSGGIKNHIGENILRLLTIKDGIMINSKLQKRLRILNYSSENLIFE